MTRANHFKNSYTSLKETIIGEIYDIVRHQDEQIVRITESRNTPAIVIQVIDDQQSEVIHDVFIDETNRLIASTGIYEDDQEYNLTEFEAPLLILILDSVVKYTTED